MIAVAAHYLFDFSWVIAGIVGAALAPTDPAVMFSVLGNKEIGGRTGTILEGESGVNDPVGIALMIGMIELAQDADATFWVVVEEFVLEMSIGLAVGLLAAAALRPLLRFALPTPGSTRCGRLPRQASSTGRPRLRTAPASSPSSWREWRIGDADVPFRDQIEQFNTSLASLAEVVVFAALGLTIDLTELLSSTRLLESLALAAILAVVARPLAVAPLLERRACGGTSACS